MQDDIPFLYILSVTLQKLELYMPTKLLLPTREQPRAGEGRESVRPQLSLRCSLVGPRILGTFWSKALVRLGHRKVLNPRDISLHK